MINVNGHFCFIFVLKQTFRSDFNHQCPCTLYGKNMYYNTVVLMTDDDTLVTDRVVTKLVKCGEDVVTMTPRQCIALHRFWHFCNYNFREPLAYGSLWHECKYCIYQYYLKFNMADRKHAWNGKFGFVMQHDPKNWKKADTWW